MAGPVRIAILANGAQARSEFNKTGSTMGKLGTFAKAGLAAAGVGLLALGKSAITAEAQFSQTMRLIGAATKAPASQMEQLNDLAIDLGAKTAFSASEAADAMLELAKAGIDTKTIMGGGLAGTLTLAAAGGTELGTAATIASNAINTFNLEGSDMASVAAALAGGANASSASVESLGQALQQVGPGATNAGLNLQETVAALSAFDAAGIKGSDAGTSLKTMLARLVPQTDKAQTAMEGLGLDFTDNQGRIVDLEDVAGQLQDRLGKLSQEQRISALNTLFGSDATRAATVLMKEGEEGIREFIAATNDQGAAQRMAKARMDGTSGALEKLSGAVDTAKLRFGQALAPAVEAGANILSSVVSGKWTQAWNQMKGVASRTLGSIGGGVQNFAKQRLIPSVGRAVGGAHEAWARQWSRFWDDPERAYDPTIVSTNRFGGNLRQKTTQIGTQAVIAFARGMRGFPAAAARIGLQTVLGMRQALSKAPGFAAHIGVDITGSFIRGIRGMPQVSVRVMGDVVLGLRSGASAAVNAAQSIGVNIVGGMVSGVRSAAGSLVSAAIDTVNDAVKGAKGALGINSPSRVMMELGRYMGDGLTVGLFDREREVARAGQRLASAAASGSARQALASSRATHARSAAGGTATATFPETVTLVVDGHAMGSYLRREIRRDRKYHDRLDDRD